MNEVIQFFNCYHRIKSQANISNGYRVLEAIPWKNPVSGNFRELRGGSKLVSYGVVFFNTLIISDLETCIPGRMDDLHKSLTVALREALV